MGGGWKTKNAGRLYVVCRSENSNATMSFGSELMMMDDEENQKKEKKNEWRFV